MSEPHRGSRHRVALRLLPRVLAVACAALFAAIALGALGAYVGWRSAPPLPNDAEALRLAGPAFPIGLSAQPQRWDFLFGDSPRYTDPRWVYLLGGTDGYQPGQVFFEFAVPDGDLPHGGVPDGAAVDTRAARAVVEAARQRMLAAGWRPGSSDGSGWPAATVRRGAWLVDIESEGYLDDTHFGLRITVIRTPPVAVWPLTTAGLLAGAAAGATLAVLLLRRVRRLSANRRTMALALPGAGLVALLPATALSGLALLGSFYDSSDSAQGPPWLGYTFILFRPLALFGAAALVVGLLVAMTPARGGGAARVPGTGPAAPPPPTISF